MLPQLGRALKPLALAHHPQPGPSAQRKLSAPKGRKQGAQNGFGHRALAILSGCGAHSPPPATALAPQGLEAEKAKAPTEALVALKPGQSLAGLGLPEGRRLAQLGVVAVGVPAGSSLAAVRQGLEASGRCVWVDALRAIPGESLLAHPERLVNWKPDNPLKEGQAALEAIGVPEAWKQSKGQGVKVALVDGPMSTDLGALRGQFEATWHVPGQRAQLDAGNLLKFHGTVTAGVIGAVRGGTLGVAPEARLLGVQVRDAKAGGSELALAEGIVWGADHGARVMTVYSGTVVPEGDRPSPVIRQALAYALAKDVLVVATAGNDRSQLSPAAHPVATCPGVLVVSSGDAQGRRYRMSNQGAEVALVARRSRCSRPSRGPWASFPT